MATYSVTGTYAYRTPGTGYHGSGQYPGAVVDAPDARTAAETYRADMIAARRALSRPIDETNVCAVALIGADDWHADPAAAMVPV
jgi:hypothetical protein